MERFDEETFTFVVIICMCTFKHGEKMHVESHAVLQGVVRVNMRLWRVGVNTIV